MDRRPLFDERVTLNKLQEYRSRLDDDESSARTDGTYSEMVEEVEKVSEMLMQTQSKLWQSQDELKNYNGKAQVLDAKLLAREKEMRGLKDQNNVLRDEEQSLRDEVLRLNQDISDLDEGRTRPELERRLRKAVEFLKKDLAVAHEKQTMAQDEARTHKAKIEQMEKSSGELEKTVKQVESKAKSSATEFADCHDQLREAREETVNLVEEVASLQEELHRTNKMAEEKEAIIRREVTQKVKEKIKMEVRETVTKQVTQKVTREVTAELKAEREKEINALREQFKKIFKENSLLKEKAQFSENAASEAKGKEEEISKLKYEISRYMSILDATKKEQDVDVSKLESHYRMKIQAVKEEAAKEKWAHASEIRKQLSHEREREVNDYTARIEALSKQTDRLLQRAEKEKDSYALLVKKRVSEEKQHEMQSLMDKLAARTKESDDLLQEATRDKEAYADQVRREMGEERRREINKYTYRLEVLTGEKESLQKRIEAFEEELNWTWQESEGNADQLKMSQSDLKAVEDELFKLKRKNQNLNTLVERYKKDSEEASKELKHSKQIFREALLKSEEQNFKLKEKLKGHEPMLEKSKHEYSESLMNIEQTRDSLLQRTKEYEEEIALLKEQNDNLWQSMAKAKDANSIESTTVSSLSAIQSENVQLKERINALESLHQRFKRISEASENATSSLKTKVSNKRLLTSAEKGDDVDVSNIEESVLALETENAHLKASMRDLDSLLQCYKEDLEQSRQDLGISRKNSLHDIEVLKEQLQDTNTLLDQYRVHRDETPKELERSKQMAEDALTVASEDDTTQLNMEIQTLERMMEMYKTSGADQKEQDQLVYNLQKSAVASEKEITRLKDEIQNLTSLLEKNGAEHMTEDSTIHKDDKSEFSEAINALNSKLESSRTECSQVLEKLTQADNDNTLLNEKMEDLNYLLDKYRNELSKTSEELEHSRVAIASEDEGANRLKKRVESLNLLLETTEQNHAKNSKELAESEKRLDEAATATEKEIARLKGEIDNLKLLLSTSQSAHKETMEHAEHEREHLETELKASEDEILEWKDKLNLLENELKNHMSNHSEVSKELKHSKRLFNEALITSEQEIIELKKQVRILAESNGEHAHVYEELEATKSQLRQTLASSETRTREQLREMRNVLNKSDAEILVLTKQLLESKNHFQLSLKASLEEKSILKSSIEDLRALLESSKQENSHLAKEFQRSQRLFKEALVAWREETRALNEELERLKNNDTEGTSESKKQSTVRESSIDALTSPASSIVSDSLFNGTTEGESEVESDSLRAEIDVLKVNASQSSAESATSTSPMVNAEDRLMPSDINSLVTSLSEEPSWHDPARFSDAGEEESTSSRKQQSDSLTKRWREETHKLIEEVAAANCAMGQGNAIDDDSISVENEAPIADTMEEDWAGTEQNEPAFSVQENDRTKVGPQEDYKTNQDERMDLSRVFEQPEDSTDLYYGSDEESLGSSSGNISRAEDMFVDKKKRVTWKDSEWDIDASTATQSTVTTDIDIPKKPKSSSCKLRGVLRVSRPLANDQTIEQRREEEQNIEEGLETTSESSEEEETQESHFHDYLDAAANDDKTEASQYSETVVSTLEESMTIDCNSFEVTLRSDDTMIGACGSERSTSSRSFGRSQYLEPVILGNQNTIEMSGSGEESKPQDIEASSSQGEENCEQDRHSQTGLQDDTDGNESKSYSKKTVSWKPTVEEETLGETDVISTQVQDHGTSHSLQDQKVFHESDTPTIEEETLGEDDEISAQVQDQSSSYSLQDEKVFRESDTSTFEEEILGEDDEISTQVQDHSTSISLQNEKVFHESDTSIREDREPINKQVASPARNQREHREESSVQHTEDETLVSEIDYSWSISSHPVQNSVFSDKKYIDPELQPKEKALPLPADDDDDSTLHWHLQNSGESSDCGGSTQNKAILPQGEEAAVRAISRHSQPNQPETSVEMEQDLTIRDYTDTAKPYDEKKVDSDSSSRLSLENDKFFREDDETKEKERNYSSAPENRDDMPSVVRSLGSSLKSASCSSSSCASSSSSASLSYSSNDSTSTYSKRVARATNQNLLDAKQEKSPSKRNKTHLPPAEDDTATTAANELRRGRNKSGFQRALEKASRRNWSKKELTSFINTKTSARRNDSKVPRSPVGEDRPFDERPEKQPIDERKVRCDESSEMGVTSSTDQAQIVAVESKE
jgi:chromosome segregation ATPase